MIEARILSTRPVSDLRDRLEWEVLLTFPRYSDKGTDTVVYFDWQGDIAFYREPMPAGSLNSNSNPNRRSLAARCEVPIRQTASNGKGAETQPLALHFSTDVDTSSLERLEVFRGGGRLYARVEGRLNLIYSSQVERQFRERNVSLGEAIAGESYELPPHQWCEEVLPQLLPPGKFLMEVDGSTGIGEGSKRLPRARTAFYEARFEDMARELYTHVERLPATKSSGGDNDFRQFLNGIHKNVKGLLNLYRHRKAEPPRLERSLAQFLLLAVMQSDVFTLPGGEEEGSPGSAENER